MRTIVGVVAWLMRVLVASALLSAVGILGSIGQARDPHGIDALGMVQKHAFSQTGYRG